MPSRIRQSDPVFTPATTVLFGGHSRNGSPAPPGKAGGRSKLPTRYFRRMKSMASNNGNGNQRPIVTIDGNEAAAYVAHKTNEVIAIYPITPSSNMGEWADAVERRGPEEHLGHHAPGGRDAVGRRRGRRSARRAADRLADHDLHRLPGPPADDPQHVQDRRRADLDGLPHLGPRAGHPRALDLRRPQRRDGRAAPPAGPCSAPTARRK